MPKDQSNEFKAYWLRDHFDLTTSAASIAWQAWQEGRADMESRLQQLMSKLADLLDEDQFAHCENIVRAAGVEPPGPAHPSHWVCGHTSCGQCAARGQGFQGGLNNTELRSAFAAKLPNVTATDRDLTVFALGVEVGALNAAKLEVPEARKLADDLEKLRCNHWSHWSAQENHIAATAVRHLRLLAEPREQRPLQRQGALSPRGARVDAENAEGTVASSGRNEQAKEAA